MLPLFIPSSNFGNAGDPVSERFQFGEVLELRVDLDRVRPRDVVHPRQISVRQLQNKPQAGVFCLTNELNERFFLRK